ncbi:MAG: extracellular solute-binding protein [Candidatus Yonathbacteria bacterium]|nr:extracellular solute-binding protein [Candidatus Yonathbacteria bacterium]
MNKSPKIFQLVIAGIFVVLLIFGFLAFSGKLDSILPASGGNINYGQVTLWGTLPQQKMQSLITEKLKANKSISINYVQKRESSFNTDFVEALARGQGPDLIILSQDDVLKKLDKLRVIPYQSLPQRDFKNTYVEEGEMFLRSDGVVAMPIVVDPLVMYWNRDIFTSALIPAPPSLWSDFYNLVPKITIRDKDRNITRSLVSFGEYSNVSHAKEIVSMLMMQAGSPIVFDRNGELAAGLLSTSGANIENSVITAMRFFTEFSKPEKDSYSWNRSLPMSLSMFQAGDLAIYLGYASEYEIIKEKNPHLNFDVTMIPQVSRTSTKLTYGRMQGVAIVAASKNQTGAFYAASLLSGDNFSSGLSAMLGLPPARRNLIASRPSDAALAVFYDSALIARGWYDPSPSDTNALFMEMFDSVTSGRSSMAEALRVANNNLTRLLRSQ